MIVSALGWIEIAMELLDDGEPLPEVAFVMRAWAADDPVRTNTVRHRESAARRLDRTHPDDRPGMVKYRKLFGDSQTGRWTEGT